MVDAFQRLDIDSVPRSNSVYAFPAHAASGEQVESQQHDGHQGADSGAADVVPVGVETQIIDAMDPQQQSDSTRVVEAEGSVLGTLMAGEDNQEDRSLEVNAFLLIPAP
ncbi:hypothetical protein PC9H_003929 [Pleurotus ostreatus]|uniref:Uncharacterized protein n=1 Tax=Pleurotus ostreatus TaxID=5322 RepID=A0A8H6ZZB7_PLEOS|nr:uncharacterized protein PC9H_003929 [Pleurotus ostreatus]KAF7437095.1 hypothetical protein PC9H_003929 [Pleurotus ostreatus]